MTSSTGATTSTTAAIEKQNHCNTCVHTVKLGLGQHVQADHYAGNYSRAKHDGGETADVRCDAGLAERLLKALYARPFSYRQVGNVLRVQLGPWMQRVVNITELTPFVFNI
ncbi:hypothetical protein DPMN_048177 [Dreissena polymorpha]|uniref:Uncharacterized protein n=1 Tax=Dreissena polymorpha TaxID=45954 RepID=A0A9D4DA64_DREPO|nr:hypothetical protein DPMN_048177 [Dreissena polymorpha]